jgi:hypothetical protein
LKIPNAAIVPIAGKGATWDVFVACQRGKTPAPVRTLIDALDLKSRTVYETVNASTSACAKKLKEMY